MSRTIPLLLLISLLGCAADEPLNPSFPLTLEDASRAIEEMEATPVKLERPVVIIGGYLDPGLVPTNLTDSIMGATGDERFVRVSTLYDGDFDAARDHVIRSVEEAFPSDDPEWTVEVDVIGHSMGGLVARYAALPIAPCDEGPVKRLRIARLFTISTPHRGARMSDLPQLDPRPVDMRRGSPLLQRLDENLRHAPYEIIPYVRLYDWVVGAENAAPGERHAWWVQNQPMQSSHMLAANDPRIVADILRRLRGEAHYTMTPAAALP